MIDRAVGAVFVALDVAVGVPETAIPLLGGLFERDDSREPDAVISASDEVSMISAFTGATVKNTGFVAFHACVAASPAGAIVVPGHSGLGKSTLAAALTRAGFGYVSDEVLALDPATDRYRAFPRPITVDRRSLDALDIPSPGAREPDEQVLDPRQLGFLGPAKGSVGVIVLATRSPNQAPVVSAGTQRSATAAMIQSCFNHYRMPRAALGSIGRVVSAGRVLDLAYSEATDVSTALRAAVFS